MRPEFMRGTDVDAGARTLAWSLALSVVFVTLGCSSGKSTGGTAGMTGSAGAGTGGSGSGGAPGATGGAPGRDAGMDLGASGGAAGRPATPDAGPPDGARDTRDAGPAGADGGTTVSCATTGTGNHYVDSAAGNDTADGTTPATAWKSLTQVNATTFKPGDHLCFKTGSTFTGQLHPLGSGTATASIVIDQYGTGAKPRFNAGAGVLDTVLLLNQSYWEINNLEVTNNQSTPGDYRAVAVRGRDAGVLHHIAIRSCFVHDVTGVVNWIGGSTADNIPPWVTFQTGWDDSKRTGGIVVEVQSTNGTPTWFDDVTIENNTIQDTSFGGIIFKQFDGGFGWGIRNSANDTHFMPHTNVVIRGNYLSQTNTIYGCNTIYVTGSRGVLIERNVSQNAGTSAIEVYNSDNFTVQYNETFGTVRKANGADFNGIDADRATTKAVIQYNYIHDNGDGILLAQFAFGDSIVRYNVIINNSRHSINLHSDASATNQTYNNLLFASGQNAASLVNSSGGTAALVATYSLRNNILFTTRTADAAVTAAGITYLANLYSGLPAAAGDTSAKTGDPMFMNSATHPNGGPAGPALSGLGGFQLRAGSPAINAGVSITGNGGVDFWGNPLYVGQPDIGPYEAP
jgi:hypothetical protein